MRHPRRLRSVGIKLEAEPVDQSWLWREAYLRDPDGGSLNRVKDHPVLLEALRILVAQGVDCHLDIVGEDTLDGRIQRMAESLGLQAYVTFHGFLPHSELRPLVENADLLLLTSRHESGPLVVLEAAVTVPVGDSQALARETAAVLADEEHRLRLAEAAQARTEGEDADWA